MGILYLGIRGGQWGAVDRTELRRYAAVSEPLKKERRKSDANGI
jgi:hypothetical protein